MRYLLLLYNSNQQIYQYLPQTLGRTFPIPYMCRGKIYGIWGKGECKLFGLLTLA